MTAFNRRIQPAEIMGLPAAGLLGLTVALAGGLMAALMPVPFNLMFGAVAGVAAVIAVTALIMGDEFPWISQKVLTLIERRLPTEFGPDE